MNAIDRRCLFSVAAAACLLSTAALPALAPPPPPGTGGGTIYFASGGVTMTMNSDGSNKTSLPAIVSGEPSLALHGGHRWFLQTRELAGQFYPNGRTRRELFGVRDDGNTALEVQLTFQPDLECGFATIGEVRWSPADAALGFIARRWDLGTGQVVEGGIYSADLVFDGAGNVLGLAAQPGAPVVSEALISWPTNQAFGGGMGPDMMSFSWSPAAGNLVYERQNRSVLRVATIGVGATTILSAWCAGPEWSPTGTRIAYTNQQGGVSTILPDGSGIVLVNQRQGSVSFGKPSWSPTSSHLTYYKYTGSYPAYHVMRSTATGTQSTNLTSGLPAGGFPIGWR